MPQTLSVFLAMLMLVSFSVSQQRAIISTHGQTYQREMSMAATDFALKRFAEIGSKQFDATTVGVTPSAIQVATLTGPGELGHDGNLNDVDDYLDRTGQDVLHVLSGEEFSFHVVTDVAYVDPDDVEASVSGREEGKKVTITVYANEAAKARGQFFVRLSRVFTPHGLAV